MSTKGNVVVSVVHVFDVVGCFTYAHEVKRVENLLTQILQGKVVILELEIESVRVITTPLM